MFIDFIANVNYSQSMMKFAWFAPLIVFLCVENFIQKQKKKKENAMHHIV